MSFYPNGTNGVGLGKLPYQPYYWWEAGAMWGAMIDYWYYTGDSQFNSLITAGVLAQTGAGLGYPPAFEPSKEASQLGNDDQCFWAIAAMSAAENGYPNPPKDQPQWIELVQNVFNRQVGRWDNTTCAGGMRWQIFPYNSGYDYKNTITQGCFMDMGARLAFFTNNNDYLQYVERTWDWETRIGLIGDDYSIYDGSDDLLNCTQLNHIQWTYNSAMHLHVAATMYNVTQSDVWKTRLQGVFTRMTTNFFQGPDGRIAQEVACAFNTVVGVCQTDQLSFKAYLGRWLSSTMKLVPSMKDQILPYLQSSAQAAAQSCVGPAHNGLTCGLLWTQTGWDGHAWDVGLQMAALETIQGLLANTVSGPKSNSTGGNSQGNSAAIGPSNDTIPLPADITTPITKGDRAGAGILTAVVIILILGGSL